jgi:hypothetical protein
MFFTEKRSGEIKACGCADGSKHCEYIAKDKATTLTVSLDTNYIQATIFAHEGRDVATCNIQCSFLHADNPNYVLMRLDGILAKLMVTIAPNIYQKYMGKLFIYLALAKPALPGQFDLLVSSQSKEKS